MKFRPIVPGSSDSQKKFTLRPAPEKPPLSKQISLRNIPETPPEAENLGYGTIVMQRC